MTIDMEPENDRSLELGNDVMYTIFGFYVTFTWCNMVVGHIRWSDGCFDDNL